MRSLPLGIRSLARGLLGIAAASVVLFVMVQVPAHGTAALQSKQNTAGAATNASQTPANREFVGHHEVGEWPADRPRVFSKAPTLHERVQRGELPPVEQRLPRDPLVVTPPEQIGPYGGTWVRYAVSAGDVSVLDSRPTYENPLRWEPAGEQAGAWLDTATAARHDVDATGALPLSLAGGEMRLLMVELN